MMPRGATPIPFPAPAQPEHNTEAPAQAAEQARGIERRLGGRTMISDMSWLISAWKAKVSTSSSAILVLVLVLGSDGREYEAQALEGCGERREPAKAGRRRVLHL